MDLAIIGYGKMGQLLERIAKQRGHKIVSIIDTDNVADFDSDAFRSASVAFEFTTPQTAVDNIKRAWEQDVKVVCGTTGWASALPSVLETLRSDDKSLFWASNFSVGVNIFWAINRKMARLMNRFAQYEVDIEEIHHIHKKDAPSGTAVTLAEVVTDELSRKNGWTLSPQKEHDKIEITAIRQGDVCGIHTIRYESHEDTITLTHEAKSREGFALGAVVAAEFIDDKVGYFTMDDLLQL